MVHLLTTACPPVGCWRFNKFSSSFYHAFIAEMKMANPVPELPWDHLRKRREWRDKSGEKEKRQLAKRMQGGKAPNGAKGAAKTWSIVCVLYDSYIRKKGHRFPAFRKWRVSLLKDFGGKHKYSSRSKSTSPMCSSQLSFRWRLCPPLILVIPPTQPCSSNHHPIPTVSYFAALYRETRMFELSLSIFVFVCGKIKVPHNGKKKCCKFTGAIAFLFLETESVGRVG